MLARLIQRAVFECDECGKRVPEFYWDNWHWLSLTARCPRCGRTELRRFESEDHIEPISKLVLSRVQKYLGAPLLYCHPCRLQFYDYRTREQRARGQSA